MSGTTYGVQTYQQVVSTAAAVRLWNGVPMYPSTPNSSSTPSAPCRDRGECTVGGRSGAADSVEEHRTTACPACTAGRFICPVGVSHVVGRRVSRMEGAELDYEFVRFSRDDAVATITLDRADAMNALSDKLERELHQALDEADADPAVRAIVLTGAGRAFSAGYDFGEDIPVDDATAAASLRQWLDTNRRSVEGFMHVMELSTPVIAAVNGWCLGGGFWYALCSDITIAAEDATFGQPEVRGISSSSILFALLAGWKNAHRYTLTGDHFDAAEALRMGIVNEVVPAGELLDRAHALAARIAMVPADSVRLNKAITTYGLEAMGLRNAHNVMAFLATIAHASGDSSEVRHLHEAYRRGGIRAFLEARDGPFQPEPGGPRSRRDG
ncbi:MAG: enoyl-CoA hydratase/isomerase family protein [Acidimicrobiia bacterium]|nr:enoyl-CoA hydratase/isomerase family protein [Acidimicrobiia bacterium]